MGKKVTKKQARQYTPLQITLLVAKFLLIKLGGLPLLLFKLNFKLPKLSRPVRGPASSRSRRASSVDRLPPATRREPFSLSPLHYFSLLKLPNLSLPRLKRGPGRPAKPLTLQILKIRLKSRYKALPKKYRVGLVLLSFLTIFFYYTFLIFQTAYELPNPARLASLDKPLTTEFYDRNNNLLYRAYEGRNRTLVELKDLPLYVAQATIAIEDKNFYSHLGIDPVAILRATYHNLRDRKLEGASTLTQQLIKNTLLTPEKTLTRKIKEIVLAFWAERIYSKDQILAMYLNEAPYGGPTWGIEAASQTYFGKSARDLTLAEAAFLAGLPASPTQFSPYGENPDLARQRQLQVLHRMQEDNYITEEEESSSGNIALTINPPANHILAPHFVMYIRDLLSQKYGSRTVSQGGLKIYTSLDLELQEEVEKIVADEVSNLTPLNVQNGAAMVLDGKTGQILAMVGSRGYGYPGFGNYNTTLALRQPGSSIKIITYATAFKTGYSPGNTVLDIPTTFKNSWGKAYSPVNYDGKFHGPVSIRVALGSSLNIPAVKMLATVGVDSFLQTSRDLGVTTFNQPQNYGLSLTLGGADVKLIEMMGVYSAFSQMGQFRKPTGILKVTDSAGNILEEYRDFSTQALPAEVSYLVTNILADNQARTTAFGPNSLLQIPGFEVAVKTGTSDSKRDNWTFGYSPNYTVGVWVGNNDNSPMNPTLSSGVTGAAPIWNKIMHTLLDGTVAANFERPGKIAEVKVDGRADLAITGNIPKALVSIKKDQEKNIFSDAFSSFATPSAQAAVRDTNPN